MYALLNFEERYFSSGRKRVCHSLRHVHTDARHRSGLVRKKLTIRHSSINRSGLEYDIISTNTRLA